MSNQTTQAQREQPAPEPANKQKPVDLDALTAAVERLLRRDLVIGRERLGGKRS